MEIPPADIGDRLHGHRWQASRGEAVAWLGFDAGRFHGSNGCNNVAGTYVAAADGGTIAGPVATTLMACFGDAADLEASLRDLLADGTVLLLDGDDLVIGAGDMAVRFAPPPSIAGRWQVTMVHRPDRHAVTSVADGHIVDVRTDGGERFELIASPPDAEAGEADAIRAAIAAADGVRADGAVLRLVRDGELTAVTMRRVD